MNRQFPDHGDIRVDGSPTQPEPPLLLEQPKEEVVPFVLEPITTLRERLGDDLLVGLDEAPDCTTLVTPQVIDRYRFTAGFLGVSDLRSDLELPNKLSLLTPK